MNSVADKGLFQHLAALGQSVPSTWAVDSEGRPVTNPYAAIDALPLPIGGYKGYGIAVMVALLTAGLSGGRIGTAVTSPYQVEKAQGTSHTFIALDPAAFAGLEALHAAVQTWESELRASPRLPGVDTILLPGDPEWNRLEEAQAQGTEIQQDRVEQLRELAADLGVTFPEPVAV
jgi:LDH2 family malate/lactate/ureidoglycolate dehydrogenase